MRDNIGFTPIVIAHGGPNQSAVAVVATHLHDRVTPICPLPACQLIGIPHRTEIWLPGPVVIVVGVVIPVVCVMTIGVRPISVPVVVAVVLVVVSVGVRGIVAAIIVVPSMLARLFFCLSAMVAVRFFMTSVMAILVHGTVVSTMVVVRLVSPSIGAIDTVVVLIGTMAIGIVLARAITSVAVTAGGLGIIGHPQACDTQGQDRC